jgi:LAGLIDADG DNA endonuclease family/Proton-conducting membrane transporter
MLILVAGDNYLILFVGWEGIGISSYLLINFWFTRIQANKSAIKAMVVNRVGDTFLSVAFFVAFWAFGNLDYATIYSLSPYMNETVLTIIGLLFLFAAMGKSAQLGLHSWLPDAIEGSGSKGTNLVYYIVFIVSLVVITNITYSLDTLCLSTLPMILSSIPKETLETMTGNMLGDGHMRYSNLARDGKASGNARYEMTMSILAYNYMLELFKNTYAQFSSSGLKPYPNILLPHHVGKLVTQYHFSTRQLPLFTILHSIWYRWDPILNRYVKVVPLCIDGMFSTISLAHWITEDGYFNTWEQTIWLCTECFTMEECQRLQLVLLKLGINSTLSVRNRSNNTFRIRISKLSMLHLITIVKPHMHKDFMYKLGL